MELKKSHAGEWYFTLPPRKLIMILNRMSDDIVPESEYMATHNRIYFKNKDSAIMFKLAFN